MLRTRHTADAVIEVGIDEAGRGCLWGPIFAAAVIWPAEETWSAEVRDLSTQIRDSKKLSAKRRAAMEGLIKKHAVAWDVGRVEAGEIDARGMTWANQQAFFRALKGVRSEREGMGDVVPRRALVDGVISLPEEARGPSGVTEEVLVVDGDATYLAIAAASILAKEGRDAFVREACEREAQLQERYGLLSSKGYGTAKHREAIRKWGMHEEHRRLFLRKLLGLEHTVRREGDEGGYAFIDD